MRLRWAQPQLLLHWGQRQRRRMGRRRKARRSRQHCRGGPQRCRGRRWRLPRQLVPRSIAPTAPRTGDGARGAPFLKVAGHRPSWQQRRRRAPRRRQSFSAHHRWPHGSGGLRRRWRPPCVAETALARSRPTPRRGGPPGMRGPLWARGCSARNHPRMRGRPAPCRGGIARASPSSGRPRPRTHLPSLRGFSAILAISMWSGCPCRFTCSPKCSSSSVPAALRLRPLVCSRWRQAASERLQQVFTRLLGVSIATSPPYQAD
mmetsp:Transcript_52310/g.144918  ORF Transcript_52310/g.144918 Transcript_52310/m.144918 type:complete len:261 (-) Transcript_52310:193-975(-)